MSIGFLFTLTKTASVNLEVNKWYVQEETSYDKQKGVQKLYSWVLYDRGHHKIQGTQQEDDWEQDKNL